MNALIEFFLRLIGREKTIEQITNQSTKIIRDLEHVSARHEARRMKAEQEAEKLMAQAELDRNEAADAAELANNWKNSGLVRASRRAAMEVAG